MLHQRLAGDRTACQLLLQLLDAALERDLERFGHAQKSTRGSGHPSIWSFQRGCDGWTGGFGGVRADIRADEDAVHAIRPDFDSGR